MSADGSAPGNSPDSPNSPPRSQGEGRGDELSLSSRPSLGPAKSTFPRDGRDGSGDFRDGRDAPTVGIEPAKPKRKKKPARIAYLRSGLYSKRPELPGPDTEVGRILAERRA